MAINWAFLSVSLLLQVIVTIVFITSFFFTYVASVEKDIVVNQVKDIVADFNAEAKIMLPPSVIEKLRKTFANLPVNTSADEEVKTNNKNLERKITIQLIVIGAIGLVLVVLGAIFFKLSVSEILLNCLFSLLAVGLAEFCFATFFAKNYKTLDTNTIKAKVISALQQYSQQK
jgi:hypothetical protein